MSQQSLHSAGGNSPNAYSHRLNRRCFSPERKKNSKRGLLSTERKSGASRKMKGADKNGILPDLPLLREQQ